MMPSVHKHINSFTDFSFKKLFAEEEISLGTVCKEGLLEGDMIVEKNEAKAILNGRSIENVVALTGLFKDRINGLN